MPAGLSSSRRSSVLVEDGQGVVHRQDVGILAGQVGYVRPEDVAGAEEAVHRDGYAVDSEGVPEFQAAEETAGDVPQAPQQLLDGAAILGGGDGMGQNAHGRHLLSGGKQYS